MAYPSLSRVPGSALAVMAASLVFCLQFAQAQAAPNAGAAAASSAAASVAASAADAKPVPPAAKPAATSSQAPSGIGQPPVLVSANSDEAVVHVVLRDLENGVKPQQADLAAGLLSNVQQPTLQTRPLVELKDVSAVGTTARDFAVELRVSGLFAFGDSTAPLLYKGRQVELLRFSKPGLVVKPSSESGYVARENVASAFPIVLENPTGVEYKTVRARLRFVDTDACVFEAEQFPPAAFTGASGPGLLESAPGEGPNPCKSYETWKTFSIPRYAQVTLRATPPAEWFRDAGSSYARSGKKKGLLTLRFEGDVSGAIHEQNLPVEVQFEPSSSSLLSSLVRVALMLVAGAVLSLVLRVSVPNIKRKRALKDQLSDVAKATASISTEVDSTLRVLLRVERLALDEIRQASWVFGPSYADFAQRVEQGLPTLKRRVDAVRRLDATLTRRRLLTEQNPAPTRLEQVEVQLSAASETLKQDNLSEEDWVFINQRLESAQKLLREPTPTEKEAFDALLAGRWRAIKEHFGVDAATGVLLVPGGLKGMEACFPPPSLLPKASDPDGVKWIQSVGSTRADLQLYALTLLWEFEFLLPSNDRGSRWANAREILTSYLETPVVKNLRAAKALLRQLAERVSEADIVEALKDGKAVIVMDPAIPRPNQRIRFTVRFRDDRFNSSAARELVACRWNFADRGASRLARVGRDVRAMLPERDGHDGEAGSGVRQMCEEGWSVHHYFEKDVDLSTVSVEFHDSNGDLVPLGMESTGDSQGIWHQQAVPVQQSQRSQEQWARASLELFQLTAALLVPLATLASQTLNGAGVGSWWELVAIGFASDTIKSILVGRQESSTS